MCFNTNFKHFSIKLVYNIILFLGQKMRKLIKLCDSKGELDTIRATLAVNFKQQFKEDKSTLSNLIYMLENFINKKTLKPL